MHSARGVSALSRGIEHSNYRGIVTILILLVLISNCRFIYKQFSSKGEALKEGVVLLLTHQGSFITIESVLWFLYANHWFVLCPAVSYLLEKFLGARASIPRSIFFCLVVLNLLYVLVFPIYYLQVYPTNAFAGMFYLMFSCIWFFKFWSYHHIWHDVRYHLIKANKFEDVGESKVDQIKTQKTHRRKVSISKEKLGDHLFLPGNLVDEIYLYPGNVTVGDVWMFCLIPTLCFQLEYPYYKKRNILGFIVRLLQCFFFIAVWITILSEVSLPITVDTVESFRKEDYWETVYYFFSLSAPNTYAWLIQFYLGFH